MIPHTFSFLTFLEVTGAVAFSDACWTYYMDKTHEKKAGYAAFWSMMIMVLGTFSTFSYIDNRMYIPAAILGAGIGTYLTVRFKK